MRPSLLAGILGAGAASDPYMFASHRQGQTQVNSAVASNYQYTCTSVVHYSPAYEVRSPRFCYVAFWADSDGEYDLGNDIVFEGVTIDIDGTRVPLKVNGSTTWTLADGDYVWTDADDTIVIPANTAYRELVATYVPTGANRPNNRTTSQSLNGGSGPQDGSRNGATTQSAYLAAGTFLNTATYTPCCAVLVVAKGWAAGGQPPIPLVIGDSIAQGRADSTYFLSPPDGVYGYISRGLTDNATSTRMMHANMALIGQTTADVSVSGFSRRAALLASMDYPFTSIISEMGFNDGAAAIITNWPDYAVYLKTLGSKPIIQCTITPKSTPIVANLAYSTEANQTATSFAAFRAWLLAGQTNLSGVIDVSGIIEPTVDSYKFKQRAFSTTIAVDFVSGTKVLVLNARPALYSLLLAKPGTADYKLFGGVQSIQDDTPAPGQYTVTLNTNVTGSVYLTGDTVVEVPTGDGSHPASTEHIALIAAVIAAKNANVIV